MIYLLMLIIFWQPLYWSAKFVFYKFVNKDSVAASTYWNYIPAWFKSLWSLVKPSKSVL